MAYSMASLAQHLDVARPFPAKRFVMEVVDLQLLGRPVKPALLAAIVSSRKLTVAQAQPVPGLQVLVVVSPDAARHAADIGRRAEPLCPLSELTETGASLGAFGLVLCPHWSRR